MWQGKPVREWTEEEKNHFLTLLMGQCWHQAHCYEEGECYKCGLNVTGEEFGSTDIEDYRPNYFTDSGFEPIRRYMEQSLPEVWEGYLNHCRNIQFKIYYLSGKEDYSETNIFNVQLDLTNLIAYLLDNQEGWAWEECPCPPEFKGDIEVDRICPYCNGLGKVKHPTLIYSESLKEEPCEK
jgi:hypothetical protein